MPKFSLEQARALRAKKETCRDTYGKRYEIICFEAYQAAHGGIGLLMVIRCPHCHKEEKREFQAWQYWNSWQWKPLKSAYLFPHSFLCPKNPENKVRMETYYTPTCCSYPMDAYSPNCPQQDRHTPCIPDERWPSDILYFKSARLKSIQQYLSYKYSEVSDWFQTIRQEEITQDALQLSHTYMFYLPIPVEKAHISTVATDELLSTMRCNTCNQIISSAEYADHIEEEKHCHESRVMAILRGKQIENMPKLTYQ